MSRVASVVSTPDQVRAGAASQGGDGTMAPGGLTFGKLVDGGRAGKMLAMYRKVAGTASATYNLAHDLGVIPAWAILVASDNPTAAGQNLCASAYQFDKWTATEVRVRVDVVAVGSLPGATMWFLIGGER